MPTTVGYIWIVPGFGGSELWQTTPDGGQAKLWIDLTSVLAGNALGTLIWGQTPAGTSVVARQLVDTLGQGYGSLVNACQQFASQGYVVQPFSYDFRQSALLSGAALAGNISALPSYDHKIICHSFGTQVARVAMGILTGNGDVSLVSRVIAIGAIFSGCYSPVKAWREEEDSLNHLALANTGWTLQSAGVYGTIGRQAANRLALLTAFTSWPSIYEILPDPTMADDPADTLRPFCYTASTWAGALVPPSQTLMDTARNGFWSAMKGPNYAIDPSRWLCVAAIDRSNPTPWRLGYPVASTFPTGFAAVQANLTNPDLVATLLRRSGLPSIQYSAAGGDNRSMLASQTRTGVQTWMLNGSHADLQSHPRLIASLPVLLHIGDTPPAVPVGPANIGFLPVAAQTVATAAPPAATADKLADQWPVNATA